MDDKPAPPPPSQVKATPPPAQVIKHSDTTQPTANRVGVMEGLIYKSGLVIDDEPTKKP